MVADSVDAGEQVVEVIVLGVEVPVTSLCPCSKEISEYGAHNQRGHISTEVRSARGEP